MHYRTITFVADRPGMISVTPLMLPKLPVNLVGCHRTFESGMRKTVQWYLANESWWKQVQDGSYQGERLGLKGHFSAEANMEVSSWRAVRTRLHPITRGVSK
ncbi:hypothetical protein ACNKHR_12210 [Shigella flexneri]